MFGAQLFYSARYGRRGGGGRQDVSKAGATLLDRYCDQATGAVVEASFINIIIIKQSSSFLLSFLPQCVRSRNNA